MELNPMLTNVEEPQAETEQTKTEDVAESKEQVSNDTLGTSDTSVADVEQKKEETPVKDVETEQKPTKTPQSKEENSAFARQRREKEEAERLSKAREEARVQAVIDTLGGINPYTQEKMVDAEDVNEYLLMKKIDAQGDDPLEKYPSALKESKREQEKQDQAKREEQEKARKDIEEFKTNYPNVNLNDLEQDEAFNDYVDGKLGRKSLSELYASYIGFQEKITKANETKKKEAEIIEKAQQNTAVGSVTTPTPTDEDTYTFEELCNLSESEINRNWKKVERSKKKLKIYY